MLRIPNPLLPARPNAAEPSARPRRTRRRLALVVTPLLAALALTVGIGAPAQAAPIDSAITNVVVTPTNPKQGSQLTTRIDWSVPNNTKAGDTFTLTLSTHLDNLPAGFTLRDPSSGDIVATATLSGTSPKVITFTMTSYASTHLNTRGSAYITSDFNGGSTPSGVSTPFTFTTGDNRSFTTDVTPTGGPRDYSMPSKYGSFARLDQGRENPTDFLIYRLDTPVGPFDSALTTDTVPAGQTWSFDCGTLTFVDETPNGSGGVTPGAVVTPTTSSCDARALSVTWPAQITGHLYRARIAVSLGRTTGTDTPAQTFVNTAQVATTVGAATITASASASNTQASAGGTGIGTTLTPSVRIVKGDIRGNAADTAAAAATLGTAGATGLVYTVTNTGTEPLTDLAVTDAVIANGAVQGLSCDFSKLGGPSSGTTWAGPLAVGAGFPCTAALTGVAPGSTHHDVGTVTARGATSRTAVTASNAYFARVAAIAVVPAAQTPASPVSAPAPTALAYTGSDATAPLIAGGAFLALGLGLVLAARRRRLS
jgi:LPXTG-motif cell wall-anchored protein